MWKTTKTLLCGIMLAGLALTAANAQDKAKVYLITMDQMDQHWANVDVGAKKAVAEAGTIDYTWLAPDIKDDAKQIEIVNNAVAAGAKVIVVAANGPTAISAALKEADAAGVKIVYVDSPADFPAVATFTTNNKAAGKSGGEEMLKALKAKGIESGKIGIVNVNSATQSVVDREAGFRSAFEGTKFEILPTQYSEGDVARSRDIAANYITDGVVGIFGTNEGTTTGVGNAIQEDGNKIIGVGFDNSDSIRNLIKGGSLIAAVTQNPEAMGYLGLKCAADVLAGGYKGETVVDTGVNLVTKDKL
ncbi:MAG: substrate-binding domain-containing protein [Methylobacteriaceae bacterium]|jgi:ribose transport system substrate-binding protein|nr:substrate-binding domain-containing protein [Methylobacteriaceae bacterium]